MPETTRRWRKRSLFLALAASLWLGAAGRGTADIILYTASVDNTGGVNPVSVPNAANPNIPPISPGVTISPNPALLDGNAVGPLNGITYGPFGFGANTGGTTGFVSVTYTIASAGNYRLLWEVSDVGDHSRPSALAIDNVKLGGNLLYGFESGIPAGFTPLGSVGTSGAVTGLTPTQGSSFAYLDTNPATGGNVPPIYDNTNPLNAGSRLLSSTFTASASTVLSLDLAFLTNDGDPFDDYGIAVLQAVPEPSGLFLATSATLTLAGFACWRRRRGQGASIR